MFEQQKQSAAQYILDYYNKPNGLITKEISLHKTFKCDGRLFYVFQVNFVNGLDEQMIIVGNIYTLEPIAKPSKRSNVFLIDNLSSLNPIIAALVITEYCRCFPYDSKLSMCDSKFSLDNLKENEVETIDLNYLNSDERLLEEAVFQRNFAQSANCIILGNELSIKDVDAKKLLESYNLLSGSNSDTTTGFEIQTDGKDLVLNSSKFNYYLSFVNECLDDLIIKSACDINKNWPDAYKHCSKSNSMINVSVRANALNDPPLERNVECIKMTFALLSALIPNKAKGVFYNLKIHNCEDFIPAVKEAMLTKKIPIYNLIWLVEVQVDSTYSLTTNGLYALGHPEMQIQNIKKEQLQEFSNFLYVFSGLLLSNEVFLTPGITVQHNKLSFKVGDNINIYDQVKATILTFIK